MKVFLLAGQSNMAGRAPAAEMGETGEERRIRMDQVCSFAKDRLAPYRSDGWLPLGVSPAHQDIIGPHFGPEIGLGRTLLGKCPNESMALIKHGRGATNLAEDWCPDAEQGLCLYADFVAQVRKALGRLEANGVAYEVAAFFWVQGEADATQRDWAEGYADHLRRLFDRVREDMECVGLPVIVAQTRAGLPEAGMGEVDLVRDAQRRVVEEDPKAAIVATDDLTLLDHVHYDGPSQLQLGRRLMEAYLGMISID